MPGPREASAQVTLRNYLLSHLSGVSQPLSKPPLSPWPRAHSRSKIKIFLAPSQKRNPRVPPISHTTSVDNIAHVDNGADTGPVFWSDNTVLAKVEHSLAELSFAHTTSATPYHQVSVHPILSYFKSPLHHIREIAIRLWQPAVAAKLKNNKK